MTCRPFLKWVGGKRSLLPSILPHLPVEPRTYFEPFLGGGAVFFSLAPKRAVLGDANGRLVRAYCGVRDDVEVVLRRLADMIPADRPVTRAEYDAVRAAQGDLETNVDAAAWLLFVNRCGFNGLYRESKAGRFNTPWNKAERPTLIDADNLRACSRALAGAEIVHGDFADVVRRAGPEDSIYCDPPYVPVSDTADFTAYVAGGFGPADQVRLRDEALAAAGRGARVVLSNAMTPRVRELYAPPFELHTVKALRRVNCKAEGRGAVDEAIVVAGPGLPAAEAAQ